MDWIYYDTQDVSTSANTDIEFFANSESVDGLAITNMPDANNIPDNEQFEVMEIHVMATPDVPTNDVWEIMEEAMIEVLVSNNRKLLFPALLAGSNVHHYLAIQDVSDAAFAGSATPTGGPYKLNKPLIIKGGTQFQVKFRTGTTAAGDGDSIIIALRGKLTRQ